MSKGENIFRRKDGRWEARYVKGRDADGKIIYGFCYGKSYKEAKEEVLKHRADFEKDSEKLSETSVECDRLSFFCDSWLDLAKSRVKNSTYVKYSTILEKHIKPRLGDCRPGRLDTRMIVGFRDSLLYEAGLSAKTVHDILVCLYSVVKHMNKSSGRITLPIEIVYPKEEAREMRVMSVSEQERLVGYLLSDFDDCKFGILLALLTGMRIGELCALRWKDIDSSSGTIRVCATMQRLKDTDGGENKTRILIGTPKSGRSARTIPMTGRLSELCERMRREDGSAYILTGNERYIEPRTLQYRFSKYLTDCGLSGIHFHTLRHTFATRAVEAGFEIKSLSEILGHSSTKITLDRYVHSSLELKRSNMDKLAILP